MADYTLQGPVGWRIFDNGAWDGLKHQVYRRKRDFLYLTAEEAAEKLKQGRPPAVKRNPVKNWFIRLLRFDVKHFDDLNLRKLGVVTLVTPPFGMLFYMLIPTLLMARGLTELQQRASLTDENENALRRNAFRKTMAIDIATFVLFLYALTALRRNLLGVLERATQLPLTKSRRGGAEEVSLKNLRDHFLLESPQALSALMLQIKGRGFNWNGVREAAQLMLPTPTEELTVAKKVFVSRLDQLLNTIDEAVLQRFAHTAGGTKGSLKKGLTYQQQEQILSEAALKVPALQAIEALKQYSQAYERQLQQQNKPVWSRLPQRLSASAELEPFLFASFLSQYVQRQALPMHVLAFLFVSVLLGGMPFLLKRNGYFEGGKVAPPAFTQESDLQPVRPVMVRLPVQQGANPFQATLPQPATTALAAPVNASLPLSGNVPLPTSWANVVTASRINGTSSA